MSGDHQNGRLPATYGKGACCTTSADLGEKSPAAPSTRPSIILTSTLPRCPRSTTLWLPAEATADAKQ